MRYTIRETQSESGEKIKLVGKLPKNAKIKIKTIPYKFPTKKEEEEYIEICEIIWGCVPIDVDWAVETKPYKRKLNKEN